MRDGHLVSESMKKVWRSSLELLEVFDRVCSEHDIQYFAMFGTLLGAVRHKGFIPWDDDIDLVVTRENYDKLARLPKDAFGDKYFLQNEHTDPGCHIACFKLRKKDTCAILKKEMPYKYSYNQGVFLDIFPLDNSPDDKVLEQYHFKKVFKLRDNVTRWARFFNSNSLYCGHNWEYLILPVILFFRIIVKTFRIPNIPFILFERELKKYNSTQCEKTAMISIGYFSSMPKKCFEKATYLPFEGCMIPVPNGYLELLGILYGDWQKPVHGASYHEGMLYDMDNSYKKYI